ncbi:Acyl-CoA thioesterase YbgC [Thalassocella blandensis]|nr:Acyl-CoA thioesterase YbgC [Thalassocella blandensis]
MSFSSDFSIPVRIYIEDTDAGGIVYYVNYLKYMERARTELLRDKGFLKPAVMEEGLLLVVASANINYRQSARLDDELQVSADIVKVARTYIVFDQRIFRGEECLTTAEIKIACVKRDTMRPAVLPPRVVKLLDS